MRLPFGLRVMAWRASAHDERWLSANRDWLLAAGKTDPLGSCREALRAPISEHERRWLTATILRAYLHTRKD